MIVFPACNPQHFLRAPFSLKEPPNFLDYCMLDWWKSENRKIGQLPDRSGRCLLKIRQRPDWSGYCLIKIRQPPDWPGHCLIKIRQLPDRWDSHHGKFRQLLDWNQAADLSGSWFIRQLIYQAADLSGRRFVRSLLVWNQTSAKKNVI